MKFYNSLNFIISTIGILFIKNTYGMKDISSNELIKELTIGWNLGNTLDAKCTTDNGYISDTTSEICWGNPRATPELFQKLSKLGFNLFRIPTTWVGHFGDGPDYIINDQWMERVKEVVDYAINTGSYAILNIHHEDWNYTYKENLENTKAIMKEIWTQIANTFKDYDEHLIFEGCNEPRKVGSAVEWTGGDEDGWNFVNEINELFINTVRSTGGNNALRHLMIPPYAASVNENSITHFNYPSDDDKIIVSLHAYTPYHFALDTTDSPISEFNDDGKSEINWAMNDVIYKLLRSKDIPVIIGEFGAIYRNNDEERCNWAKYYLQITENLGIPCILWDNGVFGNANDENYGFINRSTLKIAYPKVFNTMMCSVGYEE
ncbi:glycoside hydrolase, partial [Anaeromyces robustus]